MISCHEEMVPRAPARPRGARALLSLLLFSLLSTLGACGRTEPLCETHLDCPIVRLGTPLGPRAVRADLDKAAARAELDLPAERPVLLVMGGSQGARSAMPGAHEAPPWGDELLDAQAHRPRPRAQSTK